jgi:hypothetical protein
MTQANQAVTAFGPFFRARAFFVGARLSATFPESVRNQAVALCTGALATPEAGRQAEYPATNNPLGAPMAAPLPRACGGAFLFGAP